MSKYDLEYYTEDINKKLLDTEERVIDATVTLQVPASIDSLDAMETYINNRLVLLNDEIEEYTNHADKYQYAFSIASGIVCGVIDSLFFADTSDYKKDTKTIHKRVNQYITDYAHKKGIKGDRLKKIISELEEEFTVAQDNVWKRESIGVSAKNHHLADLAHHPTPVGLAAALAVQFLRIGIFVNQDGEWHFLPVQTTKEDILRLAVPAVITGILNWLVSIAEQKYEEENEKDLPEFIHILAHIVASTPEIIQIVKCADNWYGHLVSDMGGSKNTAGGGMGIPGVFLSLMYEIASLPVLRDSGLLKILNERYAKQKFDLRHELLYKERFGKQATGVLLNEICTRLGFMILQLKKELDENKGFNGIHWERVIPFDNRSVDRCLAISFMTFNFIDIGDAAVRAAIESGGDYVVFAGRFVARYNYVGAGRAALAIVKEFSNESKEAQLLHEKRILMTAKSEIMLSQLQMFKDELNEKLSNYLAEDIEVFVEGFDLMQDGFYADNSDLVIKGNVIIQKVLGREPQFTNQKEFDELMESDIAFRL